MTAAPGTGESEIGEAGIDRALVSDLVDTFYGHVRTDPMLGPVFAGAVGDDWGPHLDTMKRFWGAMVFQDGGYDGRPMPAHMRLKAQISPAHFERWLALFEQALDEIGAGDRATHLFLERARRIAASFQLHLFHA
ncbi:group III truncated hemoglobin [Maricaulis sp. CAU 1757]